MGGRAAEEIALGQITTGAGNDIERATELARKMVCEWGMSEKMGPLTYGSKEEMVFLGKDFSNQKNFSDQTAKLIDQEVKALVMGGYHKAREIIENNRDKLESLALALLDQETLNAEEIHEKITGKPLKKDEEDISLSPDVSSSDLKKSKPDPLGNSGGVVGEDGLPDPSPA